MKGKSDWIWPQTPGLKKINEDVHEQLRWLTVVFIEKFQKKK